MVLCKIHERFCDGYLLKHCSVINNCVKLNKKRVLSTSGLIQNRFGKQMSYLTFIRGKQIMPHF